MKKLTLTPLAAALGLLLAAPSFAPAWTSAARTST
jgi:hypothetical protein